MHQLSGQSLKLLPPCAKFSGGERTALPQIPELYLRGPTSKGKGCRGREGESEGKGGEGVGKRVEVLRGVRQKRMRFASLALGMDAYAHTHTAWRHTVERSGMSSSRSPVKPTKRGQSGGADADQQQLSSSPSIEPLIIAAAWTSCVSAPTIFRRKTRFATVAATVSEPTTLLVDLFHSVTTRCRHAVFALDGCVTIITT